MRLFHNVLVVLVIYHNRYYILSIILTDELTLGKSQNEPYCSIVWLTSCTDMANIGR